MVTGCNGMVGTALCSTLEKRGYENVLAICRNDADLRDQQQTQSLLQELKPEYIINAAARVGGILANATYPAEFLYDNLMLQANLISSAYKTHVKKVLCLGSSCIYPKFAEQPIKETELLTAPLEPTNEAYALAKIIGIKLCEAYHDQYNCNFFSAMPCNLYGIGDNFHLENSHVIPSLIRKFHDAKCTGRNQVTCWGSGTPKREFMFVDDLADALIFMLEKFTGRGFMNIGTGEEISIIELAELIAGITGFSGEIIWDKDKPDGTPRKILDISRIHALGWRHATSLEAGLGKMYDWFLENQGNYRG